MPTRQSESAPTFHWCRPVGSDWPDTLACSRLFCRFLRKACTPTACRSVCSWLNPPTQCIARIPVRIRVEIFIGAGRSLVPALPLQFPRGDEKGPPGVGLLLDHIDEQQAGGLVIKKAGAVGTHGSVLKLIDRSDLLELGLARDGSGRCVVGSAGAQSLEAEGPEGHGTHHVVKPIAGELRRIP